MRSNDARQVFLSELTVPWEENAEYRKHKRYEEPIDACSKAGWTPEYYHLAVGYVSILFFILYIEIFSHLYVHNQSQQILADSHSDRNSI